MLNNFVNFELLFTKLSGIHPYENALNNQVGMLGDMFLWLVANLKQGVIKQALPPNKSAGSVWGSTGGGSEPKNLTVFLWLNN